jgi:chemotaxis protein CheX
MLLEDRLFGICEAVWTSMLGLPLSRRIAVGDPVLSRARPHVSAFVQFTGGWCGCISLDCPVDLGRTLAASMFAVEPADLSANEMRDALGEIANIIGGNFKSLVPPPVEISLPSVLEGSDWRVSFPGSDLWAELGLDCAGEPLRVRVYQRNGTAA